VVLSAEGEPIGSILRCSDRSTIGGRANISGVKSRDARRKIVQTGAEQPGTICIVRRQLWQDILRRYTVFIDHIAVGKVAAFQSRRYAVDPGKHTVQLRIVNTGKSRSDEFSIEVVSGQTRVLRTARLTLKNFVVLPLAMFNPDRFAPRPWIRLSLEE
jgi:hypothetical protein